MPATATITLLWRKKNWNAKEFEEERENRAYSWVWNRGNEIARKKITSSDSNLKMYGIRTKSSLQSKMASFKVQLGEVQQKQWLQSDRSWCSVQAISAFILPLSTDCLRHNNIRAWEMPSWSKPIVHLVKLCLPHSKRTCSSGGAYKPWHSLLFSCSIQEFRIGGAGGYIPAQFSISTCGSVLEFVE